MTRKDFRILSAKSTVVLCGPVETELIEAGMPADACMAKWLLDSPKDTDSLLKRYRDAGGTIMFTPTFDCNRDRLEELGIADLISEINVESVSLVKRAVGNIPVFGALSSLGGFPGVCGKMSDDFERVIEIFREQVRYLLKGGVAGFLIDFVSDIQEARAMVLAVREECDLPIMINMVFEATGRTLTGSDPLSALVTMQSLGADSFGISCADPDFTLKIIKDLKPFATIPLAIRPNAVASSIGNGGSRSRLSPEDFTDYAVRAVEVGANIVGCCCGTSPDYVAAVAAAVDKVPVVSPAVKALSALSSMRRTRLLDLNQPFSVIGERINPTGKKKLQAELRAGSLESVRRFAVEQTVNNAAVLDVNMGLSGIDEKEMMLKSLPQILTMTDLPLCIDSSNPEVMEAALRLYPGRALVNSISAEKKRLEYMLPLAAKYGAMFILLPLTDDGIPSTSVERISIVEKIMAEASVYGYYVEDIAVDGLIMTISSNQEAAKVSLELIDWSAHKLKANTVCGLSNVSFGMPERKWINAAFVAMAIGHGLSMAIANPSSTLLMQTINAADAIRRN